MIIVNNILLKKIIYYEKYNTIQFIIIIALITSLFSCDSEPINNNTQGNISSIIGKSLLDYGEHEIVACNIGPKVCTEACYCNVNNFSSCCSFTDLHPCNFDNGLEYSKAVACQLNKMLNGCVYPSFPPYCNETNNTVCVDLGMGATASNIGTLFGGGNPFAFCSGATVCEPPYNCSAEIHPRRNFPITVAQMQQMVIFIGGAADFFTSDFPCSEGQSKLYEIEVKACLFTGQNCNENNKTTDCGDVRILVSYHVWCCNSGLN